MLWSEKLPFTGAPAKRKMQNGSEGRDLGQWPWLAITRRVEERSLQIQSQYRLQSEIKANLDRGVRSCLKIKFKEAGL